jgi:hypothetical protein
MLRVRCAPFAYDLRHDVRILQSGPNPPDGIAVRATPLILLTALIASSAQAAPITPTFNWRASAPGANPAQWNATIGTHQWGMTGTTLSTPVTSLPGITGAIVHGAGDNITGVDFEAIATGNPSNEDVSLELWFRPQSMSGGQQVLFETGGSFDGLSILLDDDTVVFRVTDGFSVDTVTANLGPSAAEFFQVAITLSLDGTASLYVNGLLASSTAAGGIDDWSNLNDAGLGSANGQIGGSFFGDLNGYGDFVGELALFRFYRDRVLTGAEVLQNYEAVAIPEPGTVALMALGLIGLHAMPARLRARR